MNRSLSLSHWCRDMRNGSIRNETIKYTYRTERATAPGTPQSGECSNCTVLWLESSDVGLGVAHIVVLPVCCCDIKPTPAHNRRSSCPTQFVALSSESSGGYNDGLQQSPSSHTVRLKFVIGYLGFPCFEGFFSMSISFWWIFNLPCVSF